MVTGVPPHHSGQKAKNVNTGKYTWQSRQRKCLQKTKFLKPKCLDLPKDFIIPFLSIDLLQIKIQFHKCFLVLMEGSHCPLPGNKGDNLCLVRRWTVKEGWALKSEAWKPHDLPRKPWQDLLVDTQPLSSSARSPEPLGVEGQRPGAAGSPRHGLTYTPTTNTSPPPRLSEEWAAPQGPRRAGEVQALASSDCPLSPRWVLYLRLRRFPAVTLTSHLSMGTVSQLLPRAKDPEARPLSQQPLPLRNHCYYPISKRFKMCSSSCRPKEASFFFLSKSNFKIFNKLYY